MFTLYGTTTSPFVRKVRIHALEMGEPFTFVSTVDEAGQETLRGLSPVWKVPVAVFDDEQKVLDSRQIVSALWARHPDGGRAKLRPMGRAMSRFDEENLLTIIDGALDSAINRFLLRRDGLPDEGYIQKQRERTLASLRALAGMLKGPGFSTDGSLGTPEIALLCALGWLRFRKQVDVDAIEPLRVFEMAHATRPSVIETVPVT